MWTRFAHLQYYAEYNQQIFNVFQKESQILPLERAFSFSATEEELHSPFRKYQMTKTETQRVKQYYATALDLTMNNIGVSVYICIINFININFNYKMKNFRQLLNTLKNMASYGLNLEY